MAQSGEAMSAMGAPPSIHEIDAGVWAIRVPMPGHPLRASFCYVYADTDGSATVIDPGWPTDESWEALEAALRSIDVDVARIETILLTHGHRDHSGLAGRLASISSATVALHAADHALISRDEAAHRARVRAWLTFVGAGSDVSAEATSMSLPSLPEPVTVHRELRDAEAIDVPGGELLVHWTPGHTPGHVCFEDRARGLLFSGDHLLPRITPNISTMVGHRDTALTDYLTSLARLKNLPVTRVHPGHEYAFDNHVVRVEQLLEHHRERLVEILDVVIAGGRSTTYDIARRLNWSREWDEIAGIQRRAALGEVLSHLHYLASAGAIQPAKESPAITWAAREPPLLDEQWERLDSLGGPSVSDSAAGVSVRGLRVHSTEESRAKGE